MLTGELAVETDGTVRFVFEVENTGEDPEEVTFRNGGHADCAVYDGDDEVWRWSVGQMFTQAIEHETVEPGETLRYGFEWEPPEPGEYTARAELRPEGDCTAETTFSVE
ncbi:BsuPI-related putative proteinase inhibitor [Halomarina salina]|uniref:Intracellular proteinase inhibitor BsuPI domain-containing protein n=1 Tax=Halomarina salina TaxID=1872699 RepID=A0ABD5RIH8_9EURY|nr:BsuPI-related putative proteinase inhibitor [Halomarina salina]